MSGSVNEVFGLSCSRCCGIVPVRTGVRFVGQTMTCPHCFTVHILDFDECVDDNTCELQEYYYLQCCEPA